MVTDWARHLFGGHLFGWPHALAATGTVLAAAAFVQAAATAVLLADTRFLRVVPVHAPDLPPAAIASSSGAAVLYAVPLCLLALACTVPLIFLRPAAAAVTITAASVFCVAVFGLLTVGGRTPGWMTAGGACALGIAVFRLGGSAVSGSRAGGGRAGGGRAGGGRAGGGRLDGRYLALGLTAPFLILALAGRDGTAGVLLASCVPVCAGTGIAVRARREASRSDTARTALADSLVENMARGERARIARELHDVVAHHISVISVQAETARLTTPGLSEAGAARMREIGDTARAGLTEMRRLLGVLRPDVSGSELGERQPQPGLPQIASLTDAARLAAGGVSPGRVRLIVSGRVTSYEPGVELAAYRIVQEALTNARRHAAGAAVDVELRYEQDMLRLRVRDNGPGPAGDPGAGHGLLGMRERAATVGGTLRTGEAPGGGFLVEAELPAQRHDRAEVA